MADKIEALKKLEEVCKGKGIRMVSRNETYKKPWLYIPEFKASFVFGNADKNSILCLINAL